jgi:hypothetical protein
MKDLTIREKAACALYMQVEGQISPSDLLRVARGDSLDYIDSLKDLPAAASRWLHSERIGGYIRGLELARADKEERLKEDTEAEVLSRIRLADPAANVSGVVDYNNPLNRQKLYNSIIARSKDDPKTQLDAAKMFESIQRDDREAARVQKQNRVYLPLRCHACPLYQKQKSKLKI